jgi:hypothetical protein
MGFLRMLREAASIGMISASVSAPRMMRIGFLRQARWTRLPMNSVYRWSASEVSTVRLQEGPGLHMLRINAPSG